MEEIWKDIVGYEGLYQVSNLGNIKSLLFRNNKYQFKKERILKSIKNKRGYLFINLHKNNINKNYQVHRLVCLTFLDNPENKPQVNHINGIRDDNRMENLEWCTGSENQRHKFDVLGFKSHFTTNHPMLGKFGKDSPVSKQVNQYDLEGNFIKTWDSGCSIQRELGISQSSISACCKGKLKTSGKFIWKYNNK